MQTIPSQKRAAPVIAAFVVGIGVCLLIQTPFGLLAPLVALFILTSGRTGLALYAVLATGLVGSVFFAASYEGDARDVAVTWAGFFALSICIGALLSSRRSAPPLAEPRPASIQSTG